MNNLPPSENGDSGVPVNVSVEIDGGKFTTICGKRLTYLAKDSIIYTY